MALFGAADRDMPLLSRVAQLDVETELLYFVADEWQSIYDDGSNAKPQMDYTERELSQPVIDGKSELEVIGEVCLFAHRLMNAWADSGDRMEKALFVELCDRYDWSLTKEQEVIKAYRAQSASDPIGMSRGKLPEGFKTPFAFDIISDLWLMVFGRPPTPLPRCTECCSVFLAKKHNQIFCSHRCIHRAGERRRRREKIPA